LLPKEPVEKRIKLSFLRKQESRKARRIKASGFPIKAIVKKGKLEPVS
jgi:hypothetical protein